MSIAGCCRLASQCVPALKQTHLKKTLLRRFHLKSLKDKKKEKEGAIQCDQILDLKVAQVFV